MLNLIQSSGINYVRHTLILLKRCALTVWDALKPTLRGVLESQSGRVRRSTALCIGTDHIKVLTHQNPVTLLKNEKAKKIWSVRAIHAVATCRVRFT